MTSEGLDYGLIDNTPAGVRQKDGYDTERSGLI